MSEQLNLLVIIPDQLRADYLSCYGHPFIDTRNVDALAEGGVRFERAYCAAPLCGPSRISFVTSTRVGEHGHRNYGSTINFSVPNLVSQAKASGYFTGMFGKNHMFHHMYGGPGQPSAWNRMREVCLGNYDWHPKYKHSWSAFEMEADDPLNITGQLTDQTIDFIREAPKGRGFLAWVNYQDPHPAFTCPKPYFDLFEPADFRLPPNFTREPQVSKPGRLNNWRVHSEMALASDDDVRKAMAAYAGQIRYVDDQVGRLMDALASTGRDEDTVIIFMADHGEFLGDHGVFHKLPTFHECLTRIPVIIRRPGGRGAGLTYRGLVEEVDLAPTLLEMMGLDRPPSFVGLSLLPDILSGRDRGRDDVLVEAGAGAPTAQAPCKKPHKAPFAPNSFGPGAMICDGRHKLSVYTDDVGELYDLETDPWEMRNLYDDSASAGVRANLTERLLKRCLGARTRDVGVRWPGPGLDPRFEPLES